jgi:hypothetical protein
MRMRRPSGRNPILWRGASLLLASATILCGAAAWDVARRPRTWAASDVPVAFWSWKARTPSQEAVSAAADALGARTLFLRAGQLDLRDGRVERVRPASGPFPRDVDLHLVYNATGDLLDAFERVAPDALASAVRAAYEEDLARAARDGARVVGVQLDLDSPTRLLPHYATMLRAVKNRLPATTLSITGLPTWADARNDLAAALAEVDFWVPQLYGARTPTTLDDVTPIVPAETVTRGVDAARALGRPFYAGLAAYATAAHFDRRGRLVELRGDVDPSEVARCGAFDLVERRHLAGASGEWRYLFRAVRAIALEGFSAADGEHIVVHVVGARALRAAASVVRERAGEALLGICVFRLPDADDRTTLTLGEVGTALAGLAPEPRVDVRLSAAAGQGGSVLTLEVENPSGGRTVLGPRAFVVAVAVPEGSLRGIAPGGFTETETLGHAGPGWSGSSGLQPCGARRASLVRLACDALEPGETLRAAFRVAGDMPGSAAVSVAAEFDTPEALTYERTVEITRGDGS